MNYLWSNSYFYCMRNQQNWTKVVDNYTESESRRLLTEWANSKDGDLCWDHNELLSQLCKVYDIPIIHRLEICREAYESGCLKHQNKLFGDL